MMGSITLADVDVILCPVTDKLEPIDDATDAIRTGTCCFLPGENHQPVASH
jgi:hypothetical protein